MLSLLPNLESVWLVSALGAVMSLGEGSRGTNTGRVGGGGDCTSNR
jgi:hypothetical protein